MNTSLSRIVVIAVLLTFSGYLPGVAADNDPELTVGFTAIEITTPEGDEPHELNLTVTLSNPFDEDVTFFVQAVDGWGDAVRDEDYRFLDGFRTIPAGETEIQIAVEVLGDVKVEQDELFLISFDLLSHGSNIGRDIAYVTLTNDDLGDPVPLDLRISSAQFTDSSISPGYLTMIYVIGNIDASEEADDARNFFTNCELRAEIPAYLEMLQAFAEIYAPDGKRDVECTSENGELVCDLGTLTADTEILAGPFFLVAVDASGTAEVTFQLSGTPSQTTIDPNENNNISTASLEFTHRPIGEVTILTPITLNRQTGLLEQTISFRNISETTLRSVRVHPTGLPDDVTVHNASGEDLNGQFVEARGQIGLGEEVEFMIEYYRTNRTPFETPDYQLLSQVAEPAPSIEPAGTTFEIIRSVMTTDSRLLIEFTSTLGERYVIQYKSKLDEPEWKSAHPEITASATRTFWFDDGPPKTESPVSETGQRLYRVVELSR